MKDRGMIKWQPFDSIISSKEVINNILKEKDKQDKPILSLEQMEDLNNKIFENFYAKNYITLTFYEANYIKQIKGKITFIDEYKKIIWINNNKKLHISQILKITT